MADLPKTTDDTDISAPPETAYRFTNLNGVYEAFGVSRAARVADRMIELQGLLWWPKGLSENDQKMRLARAIELYEELAPSDTGEGMLALQMVGTHHAALECLRRAMLPNQTFDGHNAAVKQATQLMSLYEKQLRTLQKSKGKGQQKVTVEHVHVEAGGQAIVGNVDAGAAGAPAPLAPEQETQSHDTTAAAEIDHTPTPPSGATRRKRSRSRRKTP